MERSHAQFEDELDFFTHRSSHDLYGRVIDRRGDFFDPATGRIIRWKKHV